MSFDLSKDIVVYRENYKNIRFNTVISNPDNCKIVVMHNGECKRLHCLEDNILNPRKLSFFKCKKVDTEEYTVFKVKKTCFVGSWGGNVQYLDKRLDNIQEKVFIRSYYLFQIFSPEKSILLFSENLDKYDSKYFNIKINLQIDNIIKDCVSQRLNEIGFIETQNQLSEIAQRAVEIINESVLAIFGIKLATLNIILEEGNEHYDFRKNYEWNKIKVREVLVNGLV